jgi:hypothetical protein
VRFCRLAQRDVYEIDALRWVNLPDNAEARDVKHHYTDEWDLFQQCIFR